MLQVFNEKTYQKDVWVKLLQGAGDGKGSRPSVEIYATIQNYYFKSFLASFQNKTTVKISSKVVNNDIDWRKRIEK